MHLIEIFIIRCHPRQNVEFNFLFIHFSLQQLNSGALHDFWFFKIFKDLDIVASYKTKLVFKIKSKRQDWEFRNIWNTSNKFHWLPWKVSSRVAYHVLNARYPVEKIPLKLVRYVMSRNYWTLMNARSWLQVVMKGITRGTHKIIIVKYFSFIILPKPAICDWNTCCVVDPVMC